MKYYKTDHGSLVNLAICQSIYVAERSNGFIVEACFGVDNAENSISYSLTKRYNSKPEANARLEKIEEWLLER